MHDLIRSCTTTASRLTSPARIANMSVEVQSPADVGPKAGIQPLFPPGAVQGLIPDPVLRSMQPGNPFSTPSTFPQPEELHPRRESHYAADQQAETPARVPIPPQSARPSQSQASPSSGPMSSSVTIPPRPRPGRKPIPQEDAADRRRLQNRIAQRNFRDKRQQKLLETQLELEDRKQDYQERINELERQLDEMRREKKAQDAAIKAAEQRASDAEKKMQQLQQSMVHNGRGTTQTAFPGAFAMNAPQRASMGAYAGNSAFTPPEDNSYHETDYTNAFRNGSQQHQHGHALRPSVSNDSMDFSRGMDYDDRCGFCTDDQNCACKNEARQRANEIGVAAPGPPGTCDACQRDPDRARQCRELAMGATMSMAPPSAPTTSCSTMVENFRSYGEHNASISDVLGGRQVRAYPAAAGGYEIEDHEAAQVLQSLSRRGTLVSESSGRDQ